MAYGIDWNVERMLEAIDLIVDRLASGTPLTVKDWAQLAVIVYKLLRENDTPLIGTDGQQTDILAHLCDEDIGDDRIHHAARQVNIIRAYLGMPMVAWKPDGTILRQLLPILIQLLPLIIAE